MIGSDPLIDLLGCGHFCSWLAAVSFCCLPGVASIHSWLIAAAFFLGELWHRLFWFSVSCLLISFIFLLLFALLPFPLADLSFAPCHFAVPSFRFVVQCSSRLIASLRWQHRVVAMYFRLLTRPRSSRRCLQSLIQVVNTAGPPPEEYQPRNKYANATL
jgi:hypothetical protein